MQASLSAVTAKIYSDYAIVSGYVILNTDYTWNTGLELGRLTGLNLQRNQAIQLYDRDNYEVYNGMINASGIIYPRGTVTDNVGNHALNISAMVTLD